MKSKVISQSVPITIVNELRAIANRRGISLSRLTSNILQDFVEDELDEDLIITKEEMANAIEEAHKLENCKHYDSIEELLKSLREDISAVN
jgi:hypothetical protein